MLVREGNRTMALYLLQKGANPYHPSVLATATPAPPEILLYVWERRTLFLERCGSGLPLFLDDRRHMKR